MRKIDLVYGGGSIGLMGLVSQAVHDGGRHVIGYLLYVYSIVLTALKFSSFFVESYENKGR